MPFNVPHRNNPVPSSLANAMSTEMFRHDQSTDYRTVYLMLLLITVRNLQGNYRASTTSLQGYLVTHSPIKPTMSLSGKLITVGLLNVQLHAYRIYKSILSKLDITLILLRARKRHKQFIKQIKRCSLTTFATIWCRKLIRDYNISRIMRVRYL